MVFQKWISNKAKSFQHSCQKKTNLFFRHTLGKDSQLKRLQESKEKTRFGWHMPRQTTQGSSRCCQLITLYASLAGNFWRNTKSHNMSPCLITALKTPNQSRPSCSTLSCSIDTLLIWTKSSYTHRSPLFLWCNRVLSTCPFRRWVKTKREWRIWERQKGSLLSWRNLRFLSRWYGLRQQPIRTHSLVQVWLSVLEGKRQQGRSDVVGWVSKKWTA